MITEPFLQQFLSSILPWQCSRDHIILGLDPELLVYKACSQPLEPSLGPASFSDSSQLTMAVISAVILSLEAAAHTTQATLSSTFIQSPKLDNFYCYRIVPS